MSHNRLIAFLRAQIILHLKLAVQWSLLATCLTEALQEVLQAFWKCFKLFEARLSCKYRGIIAHERPTSQGVQKGLVWML